MRLTRIAALIGIVASLGIADTMPSPPKSSADFERLKSLIGVWQGTETGGHGPADVRVEYRLTAGGSALEEKLFPGTPHEMVSVYYDEDGKLGMTHYCMLGNHPRMTLTKSTAKEMMLALAPT